MRLTKNCGKILRNLARCRAVYHQNLNPVEEQTLLLNTMQEIQLLLMELGIDWHDYEENCHELME